MSKYCGKCDVRDLIDIHGGIDRLYIMNDEVGAFVEINNPNLVLYYPFIPRMSMKDSSGVTVYIDSKSYITDRNLEAGKIVKEMLLREYSSYKRKLNKCKKEGMKVNEETMDIAGFNVEKAVDKYCFNEKVKPAWIQLGNRIKDNGKKAYYQDIIFVSSYEYYMGLWKEAIIEAGFDEEFADAWIRNH